MKVIKRNGDLEDLNIQNIRVQTIDACDGLEGTSYEELELDSQIHFFDGIKTSDIQNSLIKAAMNKITIDRPNWTYVAARLILYDLYHQILKYHGKDKKGSIYKIITLKDNLRINSDIYGNTFEDKSWVDKYTDEEIDELNNHIVGERDLLFDLSGMINLKERYLAKKDHLVELPQHFHMAVSMFIMQNENKDKRLQLVKDQYEILSTLKYINASPINSNGRLKSGGLISCLVTSMGDSLESITDTWSEVARGSKIGAGWGIDMSRIRAKGSDIGIVRSGSKGAIPFAKVLDSILIAVDQNGKYFA